MQARPAKWVIPWAPLAVAATALGAWAFQAEGLEQRIADSATARLKEAGADGWASVTIDGRDASLAGAAPTGKAVDDAAQAVAAVYGVRRVDLAGTSLAALAEPSVESAITNTPTPEIKGTWPEGVASTLAVTVGDQAYRLGESPELTSESGNWTLKLPAPLADGAYDVTVEVSDGAARTAKIAAAKGLTVDTVLPPKPTIRAFAGASAPAAVTGTWPEGEATKLKVTLAETAHELGESTDLSSDKGNWTLALPGSLSQGAYDLSVEVADAAGNIAIAKAPGGLLIDSEPPAKPSVVSSLGKEPVKTITGTLDAEDARGLSVTVGGRTYSLGTYTGLRRVGSDGWRLDLAEPLAEGEHAIVVETQDRAGNISRAEGTIVVDTTPPAPASLDLTISAEPLTAIAGRLDGQATDALRVTVDGRTYTLGVYTGLQRIGGDRWRLTLPEALGEGPHAIAVETIDKAGNASTAKTTIVIDATPPKPPSVDSVVSREPIDRIQGTLDGADTDTFSVSVDDRAYIHRTYMGLRRGGADRWTLALPEPLGEGDYTVTVETADKAGNRARATGTVLIDATPPAAPTVDKISATTWPKAITGTLAKDAVSLVVTVAGRTYSLGTFTGLRRQGLDRWRLDLPVLLPRGDHDVSVVTTDRAGNESRVDAVAAISIAAAPAVPTVDKWAGSNATPAITGLWDEANAAGLTVAIGGTIYTLRRDAGLTSDGQGNWSLVPEPLKDGIYDVIATITTSLGATIRDATVAEVEVDTTGPAAPTIANYYGNDPAVAISGTWPEGAGNTLTVTHNGASHTLGVAHMLNSDGSGGWSLAASAPLVDGVYDVVVTAADKWGNPTADATSAEIQIDTTGPGAPTVNAGTALPVTGTWPEDEAKSLTVTLDGTAYLIGTDAGLASDGAGTWTLSPPAAPGPGTYDVVAVASDALGNTSADATKNELVIAAPPLPEMRPPTVAKSAGNDSTPEITGTWDKASGTALTVAVGGKTYTLGADVGLTDNAGAWTLVPEPLKDGIHDVVATATSTAGDAKRDMTVAEVEIDTTGPGAPTVNPATALPVTGTWPHSAARTLRVTLAGSAYVLGTDAALTADGAGNWSLLPPERLGPGTYDIVAVAADGFGNPSADETRDELVIPKPPEMRPPTVANSAGNDPSPDIAGTWDSANGVALTVTIGGKTYTLGTDAGLTENAGAWTLVPEPLKDGIHDVVASATAKSGEVKRDATVAEVEVDTTGPGAPTINPATDVPVGGTWPQADARTLRVTLAGSAYVLGTDAALTADGAGNWSLLPPERLGPGTYDIVAVAADGFGNPSADETRDELVIPSPPEMGAPTVAKSAGNDPTPEITGTWDDVNGTALTVAIGGKTYALGTDANLTANAGAWTLMPEPLKDGVHDVVATATAKSGEVKRDATVGEVEVDTTGPAAPTVTSYYGKDPGVAIAGTWPEGAGYSLTVSHNGTVHVLGQSPLLASDGAGAWSLKPDQPLADGIYDVVATAADRWGNATADGSLAEIQIDTTGPDAPTVNPATDIPLTGTWPEGKATSLSVTLDQTNYVLGADPALTSDGAGNWTLTPAAPPEPGTYDVLAVAADELDNITLDATKDELVIAAPPPEMKPPTVDPAEATVARPKLTGTWDEAVAKTLKVTIGGIASALGIDEALTSADGKWTLAVPSPLKDGVYDIAVETGDGAGKIATDGSTDELVVDAAGPAAPTVDLYGGEKSPAAITGTWAEGDAVTLTVTPPWSGRAFALGTDTALTSDGKGRWTLVLAGPIAAGSHDVAVVNTDARGRAASDQTRFEIFIKEVVVAEPVPEPVAPAADCGPAIGQLLVLRPIQFETDRGAIRAASLPTIEAIATPMRSCPERSFEIAGHTDDVGSRVYNQALSERRASAVRRALAKAGVDAARLTAKGYGEIQPVASNDTPEGRAVNRRIEILMR